MSAQHTPAPWFVHVENNHGSKGTQVWARGGDVRVANCDSGAVSLEGKRADARLIAAAPEMLEALQLVAGNAWGSMTGSEMSAAIGFARAVIAKATQP